MKRKKYLISLVTGLLLCHGVMAEPQLDGYLSARFNMTAEQVSSVLSNDNISINSNETTDGDHLIFGQLQRSWITTDLLYVFPANSNHLALVIEVFPGMVDSKPVRDELVKQLGQPSSERFPDSVLKQLQTDNLIPNGVTELTVWTMNTGGIDRETRLMMMDKYVRVEYIDNDLMAGK